MIINPKEVKKEELKGFHKPTYDEQRFLENKNKTSRTFTVRILWNALLPISFCVFGRFFRTYFNIRNRPVII